MAQFVRTLIELVDDMDGSEGVETIEFGWDGTEYVIDLNEAHAKSFRRALKPYIEAARPKPKVRKSKTAKPKSLVLEAVTGDASSKYAEMMAGKPIRDAIRRWGRANGFEVAGRSRIPHAVVEAYYQANPDQSPPN